MLCIAGIISTSDQKRNVLVDVERIDGWLAATGETIRHGEVVA